MNITAARDAVTALLTAATDGTDVVVVDHIPDQAATPALVVWWADPWLVPDDLAGGWIGRLSVGVLAGRFEPGDTLTVIEGLAATVCETLDASPYLAFDQASGPGPTELGGVTYLASVITYNTAIGD